MTMNYQRFRSVVRNPIWEKDFLNFPISKREKIAGETKKCKQNNSKVQKTLENHGCSSLMLV
jgi:hypothetical protein